MPRRENIPPRNYYVASAIFHGDTPGGGCYERRVCPHTNSVRPRAQKFSGR